MPGLYVDSFYVVTIVNIDISVSFDTDAYGPYSCGLMATRLPVRI